MSVLFSGILLALKTRTIGGFSLKEILQLVLIVGVLGCITYTGKSAYDWAYDRGVASEQERLAPVIEKLTAERDVAISDLADYKASYARWKQEEEARQRKVDEENRRVLDEIQKRLDDEKKRRRTVEQEIHEIEKYIPEDSESNFDLPNGFVWLYNLSLQGETGTAPAASKDPFSIAGYAEAPSGTRLSTFGPIAFRNNLENVERGLIIEAWQQWYKALVEANTGSIDLIEPPMVPSQ